MKSLQERIQDSLRNNPDPWILLLMALFFLFKFSFYLTGEVLTGWDTIGHHHLAQVYAGLFSQFRSSGVDPGWFQGFPAFYFYAPFFYFLVSNLSLLLPFASVTLSFNLGILFVIFFFSISFYRFALSRLRESTDDTTARLLSLTALLFYLNYQGEGIQGASLVGVLGGTFISTMGHGIILLLLNALDAHRSHGGIRSLLPPILLLGLLFYTHFLSSVFAYMLLALYLLFYRGEFTLRRGAALLFAPPLLALPLLATFFRYASFQSGDPLNNIYPFLLSLLGSHFFNTYLASPYSIKSLANMLFIQGTAVTLLLITAYGAGIFLALRRGFGTDRMRFLMLFTLFAVWVGMDASLTYVFPWLPVHWYRIFDLFLIFFSLIALRTLHHFAMQFTSSGRIVALVLLGLFFARFVFFDPVRQERYNSIRYYDYPDREQFLKLEDFLSDLPADSLILPELTRSRDLHGSPHFYDYIIQKTGHRDFMGLTIESSLTPLVNYRFLITYIPHYFGWGFDPLWGKSIFSDPRRPPRGALVGYLRRNGVPYILGHTPYLHTFLSRNSDHFTELFYERPYFLFRVKNSQSLANAMDRKPLGLLFLRTLQGDSPGKGEELDDFFQFANRTFVDTRGAIPEIVNLNPYYKRKGVKGLERLVSGVIVVNLTSQRERLHALGHLLKREELPLVLYRFEETESNRKNIFYLDEKHLALPPSLILAREDQTVSRPLPRHPFRNQSLRITIPPVSTQGSTPEECTPVKLNLSYFPAWESEEGTEILQTRSNMSYLCTEHGEELLHFRSPLSRLVTLAMYLLLLALLAVPFTGHPRLQIVGERLLSSLRKRLERRG